jgi:hypothetical protein
MVVALFLNTRDLPVLPIILFTIFINADYKSFTVFRLSHNALSCIISLERQGSILKVKKINKGSGRP